MSSDSVTTKSKQSALFSEHSESSPRDQPKTISSLVVAATGMGKTAILAGLAKHWPNGRVMLISHRFELNQQAIAEFEAVCREDVDLEQAEFQADQRSDVCRIVVASVQTLNSKRRRGVERYRRLEKFDPDSFGLLLIDEAHHATAASYQRVIDHFKQNPDLRVVGVTATPDRLDKVGMGSVFDHVSADLNMRWGIDNGWLVPPVQKFVQIDGLDLTAVRTVRGDLDPKQLQRLVEVEKTLHEMAAPIVDVCGAEKQAIVFCASVRQAHRMAELIRDYHERKFGSYNERLAVSIDGSLSPSDPKRKQIVKDYRDGNIQFLVNMGVALEGFNAPATQVIAMGRPTKSRALYTQAIGRGGRPLPGVVDRWDCPLERQAAIARSGKPNFVVLDFVGQAGRHKLVHSADILAGDDPPEVVERAEEIAKRADFDKEILDALAEAREEIRLEHEARRAKITAGVNYTLIGTSGYDLSRIPEGKGSYTMRFHGPTEKQVSLLLKLGYTTAQIESMNKKKASGAIDYAIRNPITKTGRWIYQRKREAGEL